MSDEGPIGTRNSEFVARHFLASHYGIPPALRRKPKTKINWGDVWFALGLIAVALLYGMAAMIVGAWLTVQMRQPRVALSFPIETQGKMTTLGAVCVRAASEGALTGDLLTYCN